MRIKIENKEFDVESIDTEYKSGLPNKKIILKEITDEFDILFFKKWSNDGVNMLNHAKDYKKDVDFVAEKYSGVMQGCFILTPPDRIGEEPIVMHFDQLTVL